MTDYQATPFRGEWNEDPVNFLGWFLQCMGTADDKKKAHDFIYYLRAGSDADEWFEDLPEEEKQSWVIIERNFRRRWLNEEVISIKETVTVENKTHVTQLAPTTSQTTSLSPHHETSTQDIPKVDVEHDESQDVTATSPTTTRTIPDPTPSPTAEITQNLCPDTPKRPLVTPTPLSTPQATTTTPPVTSTVSTPPHTSTSTQTEVPAANIDATSSKTTQHDPTSSKPTSPLDFTKKRLISPNTSLIPPHSSPNEPISPQPPPNTSTTPTNTSTTFETTLETPKFTQKQPKPPVFNHNHAGTPKPVDLDENTVDFRASTTNGTPFIPATCCDEETARMESPFPPAHDPSQFPAATSPAPALAGYVSSAQTSSAFKNPMTDADLEQKTPNPTPESPTATHCPLPSNPTSSESTTNVAPGPPSFTEPTKTPKEPDKNGGNVAQAASGAAGTSLLLFIRSLDHVRARVAGLTVTEYFRNEEVPALLGRIPSAHVASDIPSSGKDPPHLAKSFHCSV
jgi:hypothetical protein